MVSGMLPFQELFDNNTALRRMRPSLGPLHSAVSSKGRGLEMFFLKGGGLVERCRAKSFGGLPRSLYLWLLILNIHTYMATFNSTVLFFQKIATCWQVGLVWGHQYHQNGCPDSMLGDFLVAF